MPRRSRPASRTNFAGPTLRLYGSDDVVGVEIRRRAEERHRDRRRRRRRPRPRAQRAGGADHARAGRDVAAGLRGGRPARDARGPERPRRSGADLHRRPQPQPARRHRARRAAARSPRSSRSMKMVAEGVRTTGAALALGARHGVELPIAAQMADVLDGRTDARDGARGADAAPAARRSGDRIRSHGMGFFDRIRERLSRTKQADRRSLRRDRPPRRRARAALARRSTSRPSRRSRSC